jgi:CheY-specific phosphatase CheX
MPDSSPWSGVRAICRSEALMIVSKFVLIVDVEDGALAKSASELKELGYRVGQVGDLPSALAALTRLDKLSLVVVNCATNPHGYESFMAGARALHPNLPVIWMGDAHNVVAKFLKQPGASDPALDVDALKGVAGTLLRDQLYANDLVATLVRTAHEVLSEFGVETTPSEPFIMANLSVLGDINAILGFSGEGLSGHVLLSASVESARIIFGKWAPQIRPEMDDLEDLLGEAANRLLGAFKGVFESRGLSFQLRTPGFIRGPYSRYRTKGALPSLAIEFADQGGMLRLELCVDQLRAEGSGAHAPSSAMAVGEIHFL